MQQQQQAGGDAEDVTVSAPISASILAPVFDSPINYRNEYDPFTPNDYGDYLKERERRRKRIEQEEDAKRHREAEEDERRRAKGGKLLLFSSLLLLLEPSSSSSAHKKSARDDEKKPKDAAPEGDDKKMSAAEKMMLKMGWKGKGLGREQQGISTPLTVEKVGTNQGHIRQNPVALYQPIGSPSFFF